MMWLKIDGIQLKDSMDKGSKLDPQSPAVFFYIGDEELRTRRMIHSGVNATFAEVFELEISESDYEKIEVEVEIFNKGFTGVRNYHVGMAKEPLKALLPKLNERTAVTVDLTHVCRGGDVKKGQLLFSAVLYDAENAKQAMVASATPAKVMDSVAVEKLSDDSKADMIRQLFGDVGELLDDTHCALQTKFIVHGRMYITKRHLLFYSKLFGGETKIRIPFHQVVNITRGFVVMPMLYVDTGSKKYVFHSFWDFELGFKTITGHFDRFLGQRDLLGHDERERGPSDAVPVDASPASSRPRAGSTIEDIEEEPSTLPQTKATLELFKAEALKARYKIVVVTEQVIPVGLTTFAKQFVEDDAPFNYKLYHEQVKDTNVVMSAWQPVAANTDERGRDIKFFKPVNLPGLASTRGVKLQNCKRFGEHGLLLSSSTRLEDVPAADCFSVDDTLEVQAKGESEVSVTISFQVTFIKSTMMKTFIEGPTNSEMKKWMIAFCEHLKKKCGEKGAVAALKTEDKPAPAAGNEAISAPAAVAVSASPPAPLAEPSLLSTVQPIAVLVLLLLIVLLLWRVSAQLSRIEAALTK